MLTVFGNWSSGSSGPGVNCEEGTFDGGFFGGGAEYMDCVGNPKSINLSPNTTSKILCIQAGSITNSTLVWNTTGPCDDSGFAPPPLGYNAFIVERTFDGLSDYVQYNSNHAVDDVVLISSHSGCFTIMGTTEVWDPSIFGVITGECLD